MTRKELRWCLTGNCKVALNDAPLLGRCFRWSYKSTYYSRVESFWDFFLFWKFYDIWSDLVRKNSDNWVKLMVDLKVSVFLEFITFLGGEKLSRFMECHLNSSLAFEYFHRLFSYSIWRIFSASGNEVSSMNRTQATSRFLSTWLFCIVPRLIGIRSPIFQLPMMTSTGCGVVLLLWKKSQAARIKAREHLWTSGLTLPYCGKFSKQNFTAFHKKSRILTRSARGQDPSEYSITELSIKLNLLPTQKSWFFLVLRSWMLRKDLITL